MKKLSKKWGFTLIELLVVVAIITLLISISIPALNKARNRGRQANSLGNAGQIMKGVILFALDNRNQLPGYDVAFGVSEIAEDKDSTSRTDSPIDYVGDPKVFQSPADRGSTLSGMSGTHCFEDYGTSYAYASVSRGDVDSISSAASGSYRMTRITNSTAKVILFEPIIATPQSDPKDNWYGGKNGSGGGVAAFLDGHAEVITPIRSDYY